LTFPLLLNFNTFRTSKEMNTDTKLSLTTRNLLETAIQPHEVGAVRLLIIGMKDSRPAM
jgi:hypothetical protein